MKTYILEIDRKDQVLDFIEKANKVLINVGFKFVDTDKCEDTEEKAYWELVAIPLKK